MKMISEFLNNIKSFISAQKKNILFIGSNDNNLYAIDANTGKSVWTFKSNGRIISSPLVFEQVVFVGSEDKKLYAIDIISGKVKWATDTEGPISSSPNLSNEHIYISCESEKLYSINILTGIIEWIYKIDYGFFINHSPLIFNSTLYIHGSYKNIFLIDTK